MYWDCNATRSHNSLINLIYGNRGGGKTYGALENCIDRFIKKKEQFIYLRRYITDLDDVDTILNPIIKNNDFPGYLLEAKKDNRFYVNGDLAGFALALSVGSSKQSVSYDNVWTIILDEFILHPGVHHYLSSEAKKFMSFYNTVSRYRSVIVFMLGNAITVTNPYFVYFNVYLPHDSLFYRNKTTDCLLELVQDPDFIKQVSNTRAGRMMINTDPEYAQFAINNKSMQDNNNFIEKKSGGSRHTFSMRYMNYTFGVWIDYMESRMYISESLDPTVNLIYAITTSDHSVNTMLIQAKNGAYYFKFFLESYKIGNVRFENLRIKNLCREIIRIAM